MEEKQFVFGRMSSIARYIYEVMPNFDIAGYVLFVLIFLLSVLVYKLGFAKKLRFSQNVVIYVFLLLGCLMLTFLAFFLPVVEGLIVAALILIIYKIRLRLEKKQSSTT
ncbi:YlaH-like protein [Paenisporosarcina quisquiliarum]|uniref:YlaH-like family protein n=1 Tax=Psychrobacillus TaxID=1221880 RepID=UPI000887846D|nr:MULTISPECIES: YlaH-like family protein [Psychrobacillus]SEM25672.1 YlaH-like protein [Paenisporosarcina quisquiliarum]MCK1996299.1 YlaH-like family protein [Psychrobacillus psychrodurans]MCZ8539399.1 YlaH-like family protein [Psychrobacillus psychrodurans]SDM49978.1 YlaH-like protein [Psychrobacillus sp. OK028]SFM38059.1 YlaH-like protein [Psychrobacillus psychrodurans]